MSPQPLKRRKIIGVMGSGDNDYPELTRIVGRVIATLGYHLLTGAGQGVMHGVAKVFTSQPDRQGLSLGIVCADGDQHLGVHNPDRRWSGRGPNDCIELAINTHLPDSGEQGKGERSRNHINVLTSHAVVVLPGGSGTFSELELALEYGRPTLLFLGEKTLADLTAAEIMARLGPKLLLATTEAELTEQLQNVVGTPIDVT